MKKWSNFSGGKKFVQYFLGGKSDVLRESCRADIRSMCGLGYPPRVYTQNANECMNRLIKQTKPTQYGKKSRTLMEYVENIESEVKRQQEEQFLAVIGRGEYRLKQEYKFLRVDEADYYRMTTKQKAELKNKFFKITVSEKNGNVSTEENIAKSQNSSLSNLSVTADQSQIISVPFPILSPMFEKASRTVENKDSIWKVPAVKDGKQHCDTYMVVSQSSTKLHTVSVHPKSKKVECDTDCANFTAYRICSHCIAAAQMGDCLQGFLSWYRKNKKRMNLTAVVNMNMPAGAGKKMSKATQRRKGSANKESGKSLMPTVSRLAKDREGFDSFQPQQVPTTTTAMLGRNDMSFSALNAASVQERGHSHCQNQMGLFHVNPTPCSLQHIPVPLNSMPNNAVHGPFDREHHNIGSVTNPQINTPAKPNPAPGTYVVALLRFTDPRVSKCYGCRGTLKPGSAIPYSPNDMVVVSKLFRRYFKDGREHTSPDLSMVYFHANMSCILLQCPGFLGNMLYVPPDLIPHLQESHKALLRRVFCISLY